MYGEHKSGWVIDTRALGTFVVVVILAGVIGYAFFSGNFTSTNFKQDKAVCQNFCTLSNAEFAFVDKDQNCNCLATQTQIDAQNDALIQWQTIANVGKISNVTVVQPIPDNVKQAINQQLQQQQLLQQQQQTQPKGSQ